MSIIFIIKNIKIKLRYLKHFIDPVGTTSAFLPFGKA